MSVRSQRRRPPAPRPPGRRAGVERGLLLLLALLAYMLGRETTASPPSAPPSAPATASSTSAPDLTLAAATSTTPCCPCPRPRPPRGLTIARKKKAPVQVGSAEPRDVTEATARYLREQARTLAECAPQTGGDLRVHLELTITPRGVIDRVRVTNLEAPPVTVTTCVEAKLRALSPPPFDSVDPEVFALTVVL